LTTGIGWTQPRALSGAAARARVRVKGRGPLGCCFHVGRWSSPHDDCEHPTRVELLSDDDIPRTSPRWPMPALHEPWAHWPRSSARHQGLPARTRETSEVRPGLPTGPDSFHMLRAGPGDETKAGYPAISGKKKWHRDAGARRCPPQSVPDSTLVYVYASTTSPGDCTFCSVRRNDVLAMIRRLPGEIGSNPARGHRGTTKERGGDRCAVAMRDWGSNE